MADDLRFRSRSAVVASVAGATTVLLDRSHGLYYGVGGLASRIWPLLAQGCSVAELAKRLHAPETAAVVAVVTALLAARLIEPAVPAPDARATASPHDGGR
jgi:hypothetical protein